MGFLLFAIFAGMITLSIWKGTYIAFGGLITRQSEPRLFWAGLALFGLMAVASLWLQLIGEW